MDFFVVPNSNAISDGAKNAAYLLNDNWNDYGYETTFGLTIFDEYGVEHDFPRFKIGFAGQTASETTRGAINDKFTQLSERYFSLCHTVRFYKKLYSDLSENCREEFLRGTNDVVRYPELLDKIQGEDVFQTSLLRSTSIEDVRDLFTSVLRGEVLLTDFDFSFELPSSDTFAGFDLSFSVTANSKPSTNMHALIGRNGVGKTTLLNSMVRAIAPGVETDAEFYIQHPPFDRQAIDDDYFSTLVSVAFSAFDPFDLPPIPDGTEVKTPYSYIGLTSIADEGGTLTKGKKELYEEFAKNLEFCLAESGRKRRWQQAMAVLQSDQNFSEMDLMDLAERAGDELREHALFVIEKMSSGHTIVILTLTSLVARIEEKTLVLFDEPETHLHPPLLSALMRSLSQLLHSRNAVAIIATHSPVVLQEIPSSCVWKVYRERLASQKTRPNIETFGENVGTLTREVFKLEVARSGFHTVLEDLVKSPKTDETYYTYDEIIDQLGGKLGFEARGILKSMVVDRDEGDDLV
ncbi:AAA domain-containing protein, putative AbiEii toxin, Type IV TA system [Sulfitobacter litoralis]|uniref:AAA domain-containing protein, putative AbiEii toxin, Type IV TA system n=1 Tax=Sulfitobacter litoralis TaxID=335975 RepID=A0ABY0SIZ5_9RHOB|nr:AAA family ATPase [Sulfitobacter litoralis]SDP29110.1 AAA domain-containing protein, putative AbiEii toxin, Type IV TA system [Sulfitobacter litoralis]